MASTTPRRRQTKAANLNPGDKVALQNGVVVTIVAVSEPAEGVVEVTTDDSPDLPTRIPADTPFMRLSRDPQTPEAEEAPMATTAPSTETDVLTIPGDLVPATGIKRSELRKAIMADPRFGEGMTSRKASNLIVDALDAQALVASGKGAQQIISPAPQANPKVWLIVGSDGTEVERRTTQRAAEKRAEVLRDKAAKVEGADPLACRFEVQDSLGRMVAAVGFLPGTDLPDEPPAPKPAPKPKAKGNGKARGGPMEVLPALDYSDRQKSAYAKLDPGPGTLASHTKKVRAALEAGDQAKTDKALYDAHAAGIGMSALTRPLGHTIGMRVYQACQRHAKATGQPFPIPGRERAAAKS